MYADDVIFFFSLKTVDSSLAEEILNIDLRSIFE